MSDIVERLRLHEHRLLNEEATMRLGYCAVTEKEDRWNMGHSLDDAADEIERLRALTAELVEALELILPLAKGYNAIQNSAPAGCPESNRRYVQHAEAALSRARAKEDT